MAPTAPLAADWVKVASDDEAAFEMDRDSVQREGQSVRFALRTIIAPTASSGYGRFDVDYRIDCERQTATILAARGYDRDGVLWRSVEAPPEQQKAEPMTSVEPYTSLVRLVCPGAKPLPAPTPPGPPPVAVTPR